MTEPSKGRAAASARSHVRSEHRMLSVLPCVRAPTPNHRPAPAPACEHTHECGNGGAPRCAGGRRARAKARPVARAPPPRIRRARTNGRPRAPFPWGSQRSPRPPRRPSSAAPTSARAGCRRARRGTRSPTCLNRSRDQSIRKCVLGLCRAAREQETWAPASLSSESERSKDHYSSDPPSCGLGSAASSPRARARRGEIGL